MHNKSHTTFLSLLFLILPLLLLQAQVLHEVDGESRVTGNYIELIKPSNAGHFLRLSSEGAAMDINSTTDLYLSSGGNNILLGANHPSTRVGIGTAAPTSQLEVIGGIGPLVKITPTVNNWNLGTGDGDFRIGNDDYHLEMSISIDGGGAGIARIQNDGLGDSGSLILGSNNTDVLFIHHDKLGLMPNGNVGIGTNNPLYPLHLEVSGHLGFLLRGDNSGDAHLNIRNVGGGNHFIFDDVSKGNALGIESSGEMLFNTNGVNERMRIDNQGRVGIGTNNPSTLLHIVGSTPTLQLLDPGLAENQKTSIRIGKQHFNNQSLGIEFKYREPLSATSFHFWGDNFGDALIIQKGGDIGIGTDSPEEKLHVIGNIRTSLMVIEDSDERYKKQIRPIKNVLKDVLQLKPVIYTKKGKQQMEEVGFIAQDLEVYFPDVVKTSAKGFKSIAYSRLTAILVGAIQEQQVLIEKNKADFQTQMLALEQEKQELKNRLTKLENLVAQILENQSSNASTQNISLQKYTLGQNHPNPFDENTTIAYEIPEAVQNAFLQITSSKGEILKTIPLNTKGKGQVILESKTLTAGIYYYSLILDGVIKASQQMVLTK